MLPNNILAPRNGMDGAKPRDASFTPTREPRIRANIRSGAERVPAWLGEYTACRLLHHEVELVAMSGPDYSRDALPSILVARRQADQRGGVAWCDSGGASGQSAE
jgi:hypothetical protein